MRDLQPLAGLRDQIQAPSYDALADTARRRDRRTAVLTAAGSAAVVLAVVAGALMATGADPDSAPGPVITPTPTPTPSPTPRPTYHSATSMTPKEVVSADGAHLVMTAVSADDPDFRVSFWEAECTWCPRSPKDSRFPHPSFSGMAITSDGFATATYRRTGPLEYEEGGLIPVDVVSPGPGLLLLVGGSEGEWLVRDDGTITRPERVFDASLTSDPRSWFPCQTEHDPIPSWVNPDEPAATWCRLDADANTVHVLGSAWWGLDEIGHDTATVVSPVSGSLRWGLRNQSFDRLVGWWEAGGSRHAKDFGPAHASGAITNAPVGVMSYWAWQKGSPTLTIFTSSDEGTSWQRSTVPVPYRPISPWDLDLSWTPDGALLGLQENAFDVEDASSYVGTGIRLWRSASPGGGAFTKVYEGAPNGSVITTTFTVINGRIWSNGLWSDDDGVSWHAIPRWR